MLERFQVRLSWDFVGTNGEHVWGEDLGTGPLDAAPELVEWRILRGAGREIGPEHIADCDGLVLLGPRVSSKTFAGGAERLTIIGRHGVGYDSVDVDACTHNDVALFITPESSRHPVAAAALTFILALSRRLFVKDRLVRERRWLRLRTRFCRPSRVSVSRAAKGSSMSRRSGSRTRVRAMATRWRWPPLNSAG